MSSALQKYLEAASGLTTLTASRAEQIVKQLVRSGEAASDQVGDMVDELLDRQRGNREAVTALVRSETTRAVRAMGLATSTEVERLQKQVADLKRELRRLELDVPPSGPGGIGGGSAPARPSSITARKSTKKTAAKATGKTTAKKSTKKTAAKATGKTTAKKSTKKTAAKKSTKKTAAKKASS